VLSEGSGSPFRRGGVARAVATRHEQDMRPGALSWLLLGLVALMPGSARPSAQSAEGPPAQPAGVTLRYEVSWSLIPLLEIESRSRVDPSDYAMDVEMETVGVVDLLFSWRANQATRGALESAQVAPRSFRSASEFRGRRQDIDLGYGPQGLDRERVEGSTVEASEREEVPPELRRDTVDPLSAVVQVSRRLVAGGTCTGTSRVFDGVRRYDLNYEDLGERELEDGEKFTGRARLCRATMVPIGGFWRPTDREPDSLHHIDAYWAAPWPGADPVPVKLALEGSRGTLDVRLVEALPGDRPSRDS
jgi:hypothetical protein